MANINHRVGIKASPAQVYEALSTVNGIAGWWTVRTSGSSAVGENIDVKFVTADEQELGSMKMQVLDLQENKLVQWRFLDGPPEWIGTDVVFELQQADDYTIILFSHKNWSAEVEFMYHCSMKWAVFLLSLKELLETGTGKPAPHDVKIDNWN